MIFDELTGELDIFMNDANSQTVAREGVPCRVAFSPNRWRSDGHLRTPTREIAMNNWVSLDLLHWELSVQKSNHQSYSSARSS